MARSADEVGKKKTGGSDRFDSEGVMRFVVGSKARLVRRGGVGGEAGRRHGVCGSHGLVAPVHLGEITRIGDRHALAVGRERGLRETAAHWVVLRSVGGTACAVIRATSTKDVGGC